MDLKTYRFPKSAAQNVRRCVLAKAGVIVAANWSKGDAPFQVRLNRCGKETRPVIASVTSSSAWFALYIRCVLAHHFKDNDNEAVSSAPKAVINKISVQTMQYRLCK